MTWPDARGFELVLWKAAGVILLIGTIIQLAFAVPFTLVAWALWGLMSLLVSRSQT